MSGPATRSDMMALRAELLTLRADLQNTKDGSKSEFAASIHQLTVRFIIALAVICATGDLIVYLAVR